MVACEQVYTQAALLRVITGGNITDFLINYGDFRRQGLDHIGALRMTLWKHDL